MGTPDAIKYELGLTIVALVVFWVWQTITLKRDMRKTAEEEARRAEEPSKQQADDAGSPPSASN